VTSESDTELDPPALITAAGLQFGKYDGGLIFDSSTTSKLQFQTLQF